MDSPSRGVKRKALSLETKFEILENIKNGEKRSQIANIYGVSQSTLTSIVKKEKEMCDSCQCSTIAPSRKRHRSSNYENVERALYEWFKSARAQNLPVSGHILLTKCEYFAKQLGSKLIPNRSWIDRFKVRYGIVSKSICGESGVVDTEITENWISAKLPALINGYAPENIFNADETGLFYKLLPNRSLEIKGSACVGGKKSKERLTFLVACNMSGSEKLPLLVIGKFEKPRCFKGLNSLTVTYKANKRAWMTSVLFQEWLIRLDRKFKREKRKVLLFVDNCAAHPDVSALQVITLRFLPPNTTSVLQPCDQGIIYNFKVQYRQRLIKYVIECFDKGTTPLINVLVAIRYAYAAWQAVNPVVISKCFRKCGFVVAEDDDDDDNVPLATLKHTRFLATVRVLPENTNADVVNVNTGVATTEDKTDSDIITDIQQPGSQDDSDDEEEEEEETTLARTVASKETTLELIENIRHYLENTDDIGEHVFSALNVVEHNSQTGAKKQIKISDFFTNSS